MKVFSESTHLGRYLGLGFILLFLSGCASQVPVLIKLPPEPDIQFHEVKKDIQPYQDQYIRWGGEIISVENKENTTWVEILVNPLDSYGLPDSDDAYKGRFIARLDGFLDPEHYKKGRKFTVYGKVESTITRQIDKHPYNYPLVYAEVYYLWREHRYSRYDYPYYPRYYYGSYYRYPPGFFHRYHFGFHHHRY